MGGSFLFYCCLAILLTAIIAGLVRWKNMDKALRIFWVLVSLSFMSEITALYCKHLFGTKAPVYHFFSIAELFLISLYFIYSLSLAYKRWHIALIALVCLTLGLSNLYFFQPLLRYNTNMLMIECVLIIAMALFALFRILLRDDLVKIFQYPHFKIWIALLVLWTSTFFFWALLSYLREKNPAYYSVIATGQVLINLFFYSYIALIFSKQKVA